jgi:alanine racemase
MRPTFVEVNQTRIVANLRAIRAAVGQSKVMGIVKANAYGHGIIEIARSAWSGSASTCWASPFWRRRCSCGSTAFKSPILVFGGIAADQIPLFSQGEPFSFTASSVEKLQLIDEAAAALKVRATGASQDRYGHGAHRRALLQRRKAARGRAAMSITAISRASTPTLPTRTQRIWDMRDCSWSASVR